MKIQHPLLVRAVGVSARGWSGAWGARSTITSGMTIRW